VYLTKQVEEVGNLGKLAGYVQYNCCAGNDKITLRTMNCNNNTENIADDCVTSNKLR